MRILLRARTLTHTDSSRTEPVPQSYGRRGIFLINQRLDEVRSSTAAAVASVPLRPSVIRLWRTGLAQHSLKRLEQVASRREVCRLARGDVLHATRDPTFRKVGIGTELNDERADVLKCSHPATENRGLRHRGHNVGVLFR